MMPVVPGAVAATDAGALRHAEHALHATDGTADRTPDDTTHGPADRTGRAIACGSAVLCTADDTLRLSGHRKSHEGGDGGGDQNTCLHAINSMLV
jgi:hypothetical protein